MILSSYNQNAAAAEKSESLMPLLLRDKKCTYLPSVISETECEAYSIWSLKGPSESLVYPALVNKLLLEI